MGTPCIRAALGLNDMDDRARRLLELTVPWDSTETMADALLRSHRSYLEPVTAARELGLDNRNGAYHRGRNPGESCANHPGRPHGTGGYPSVADAASDGLRSGTGQRVEWRGVQGVQHGHWIHNDLSTR